MSAPGDAQDFGDGSVEQPTWSECAARVAFATGVTFMVVWLSRGLQRDPGDLFNVYVARDMATGLGVTLLGVAPVASFLRAFYRAPEGPTRPWAVLWSMVRIFWMAPIFATLLLFALCFRMVGWVAPGWAREMRMFEPHVPRDRWINAEVLTRSWVGVPMWVIFWMTPMQGRHMRLVWDHARLHAFTRAWFPFVLAAVALLADAQPRGGPRVEATTVAAFLSFSVADYLVLAAHAGGWRVGQGLIVEEAPPPGRGSPGT